ncbi:MAG: hypothetical protein AVDCRST_MAG11-4069, partial [uncultured Gemmatimonadaceae bacterium]
GEGADHEQARMVVEQRERGVGRLAVGVRAQRLVQQDDGALGQRVEEAPQLPGAEQLPRRVVRVAQGHDARARGDRREHRLRGEAGHGHRPRAGAAGHERV